MAEALGRRPARMEASGSSDIAPARSGVARRPAATGAMLPTFEALVGQLSSWIVVTPGVRFGSIVDSSALRCLYDDAGVAVMDGVNYFAQKMSAEGLVEPVEVLKQQWMEALREAPTGGAAALRQELGAHALLCTDALEAAEGGDARVLAIVRDENSGQRWRDRMLVSSALNEQEYDDWPFEGPRTMRWAARDMSRAGGGPLQHHERWHWASATEACMSTNASAWHLNCPAHTINLSLDVSRASR